MCQLVMLRRTNGKDFKDILKGDVTGTEGRYFNLGTKGNGLCQGDF